MHKIRFPLGFRLRPRWGSLQRSPDLLAVFQGDHILLSGGRGKKERRRRVRERKGKGRGGGSEWKGREGSGGANSLPQYFGLEPPLLAAGIDLCSLMTCTTAHKEE